MSIAKIRCPESIYARTALSLFVAAVFFAHASASALADRGRVFGPSFGAPGSGAGQLALEIFTKPGSSIGIGGSGLAVDESTHDVYVADTGNQRVDEFTSNGVFVRAWGWGVRDGANEFQICTEITGCLVGIAGNGAGQFESPAFVAVDDTLGGEGDLYVSDYDGSGGEPPLHEVRVQKFTSTGALIETWGTKGRLSASSVPSEQILYNIAGLAVDPSGDLVVAANSGIFKFNQMSGAYLARVGESVLSLADGFPLDGAANFFNAFNKGTNNGQLIEKFNVEGIPQGIVFELRTPERIALGLAVSRSGELYVDEGNAIQVISASCASLCEPIATFTSPELINGAGLAVDSASKAAYIAEVAQDKIESIVPEPPAAPRVELESEAVSNVSGGSATLEAVINPRSEPDGAPTSYYFQYVTDQQFQADGFADASRAPISDGQLLASFEAQTATAHIQGLAPDVTYHYRVVAENAISRQNGRPVEGERDRAGTEVSHTFTTQNRGAFSLPDDRAWQLVSPPDKHGALLGFVLGDGAGVYQAAADGNAVTYLASAPTESGAPGGANETQVLSTRGGAVNAAWGSSDISPPHEVPASWKGGASEDYRFFSSDLSLAVLNVYGPFDSSMSAEASEQTPFLRTDFPSGDAGARCASSCYRPLVTSKPGFANVPEGTQFGLDRCRPGEKYDCGPQFAGATTNASHVVIDSQGVPLTEGAASHGLYEWYEGQLQLVTVLPGEVPAQNGSLGLQVETASGSRTGVGRNAISSDGSRVVWSNGSTFESGNYSLYVRDLAREETVQLGGLGATFQAASSDGSHVFFIATGDLYEFEAPANGLLSAGRVTNLTPAGGVLGFLPGVSQDGSFAYLVSQNVLTGEANQRDEVAQAGQPNLYVEQEGTMSLVAVLSGKDEPDWMRNPQGFLSLTRMTSRVSANGRWLTFMSERPLTGYDNRDVSSGKRDQEVYLYDANTNGGHGALICTSCNPTGARPHGALGTTGDHELLVDPSTSAGLWSGQWLAANVPGWMSSSYQPRYLNDSGRLFFNSDDALVPSDTNGTEDVYEYEPAGVGNCTNGSTTFEGRSGGCVDLVSSGTSPEESAFIDASESGDDVFFFTSSQLVTADFDSVRDVYDARVDGGAEAAQPPPACEGDACQSPVAAPNDPTPGSLTYSGPGNPVPLLTAHPVAKKKPIKCSHVRRLSHGRCVKNHKPVRRARRSSIVRAKRQHATGRKG